MKTGPEMADAEQLLAQEFAARLRGWIRHDGTRWQRFVLPQAEWVRDDGRRRSMLLNLAAELRAQESDALSPRAMLLARMGMMWRLDGMLRLMKPLLTSSGPQSLPPGEPPAPQG